MEKFLEGLQTFIALTPVHERNLICNFKGAGLDLIKGLVLIFNAIINQFAGFVNQFFGFFETFLQVGGCIQKRQHRERNDRSRTSFLYFLSL
jgi:hypothetical protein